MTTRIPLGTASLAAVAATRVGGLAVEVPRYTRKIERRICHVGVGGFHRAHQAHVLHELLQSGSAAGWGICGIGLKPFDRALLETLGRQDGLYSLWESDPGDRRVSVLGSIMELHDASRDVTGAIARIADPATRIVSLTITEAGYCLGADGDLDETRPDIDHDLAFPAAPVSAPGLLVAGLDARRAAKAGGVTLMSCDNLVENGHKLKRAVLDFARRRDATLARWIDDEVRFPLSMVDRITPAADAQRREASCAEWGVKDDALVLCEGWRQWILEDDFAAGRPAFEDAGVVLSNEVSLYEDMKVGMLNGGHSALSHLSLMLGHVKVHEAVADPAIARWLTGYMTEVAQTLEPIGGVDFGAYRESLVRRFANPAVEDRLLRLAQDTSAKFQQALLPPLVKRLERGQPVSHLATAIALWIVYLRRTAADPASSDAYLDVRKADAMPLAAKAVASGDAGGFLAAMLPLHSSHAGAFRDAVGAQLRSIAAKGPAGHVAGLADP